MSPEEAVDLMLTAAKMVAMESGARHPDDLAASMITSIEANAVLLSVMWRQEQLKLERKNNATN